MSALIRAPLACALADEHRGTVAVMGSLDGVHKGHQALLSTAKELAAQKEARVSAVTFEPHPRRIFQPDAPPFLLTTLEQKAALLERFGCARVFALPFTEGLYTLLPEAFVQTVLCDILGLSGVVVGEDFRFGAQRSGDTELLARAGAEHGIDVVTVGIQSDEGVRYSSTAARQALREGRPDVAAQIMGRPFTVESEVLEGRRLARTLDYPTANMEMGDLIRPRYGVYAVRCRHEGRSHDGVANLGVRPTVDGETERLEVHLFDFEGDLYGKPLRVEFASFLREEETFSGLDALKAAIARDADAARKALNPKR